MWKIQCWSLLGSVVHASFQISTLIFTKKTWFPNSFEAPLFLITHVSGVGFMRFSIQDHPRLHLCSKRILYFVDFHFRTKEESCIHIPYIGNWNPSINLFFPFPFRRTHHTKRLKQRTAMRKQYHTKRLKKGCIENENKFSPYHGFLSMNKCTQNRKQVKYIIYKTGLK